MRDEATEAWDKAVAEALEVNGARSQGPTPQYAAGKGGQLAEALTENAQSQIAKIRSSHDTIVDMMICHPEMTKAQIAAKLGYTPTYLSIVTGSDAFKVRMAKRRAQFVDPVVAASVEEMFGAMTERACEVLLEKLNQPTNTVDPQLALQAAQLGAKVAGMGGFGAKVAVVNVAPSEERLNRLADNLTRLAGGLGASQDPTPQRAEREKHSPNSPSSSVTDAVMVEARTLGA
jgi:hypothetical protein